MNNLKQIGVVSLNKSDAKMVNGGVSFTDPISDAFHWAYTQFKKGFDDGYNGR